ncbi:hypothetical protein NYR55_04770 [Sphingomonas sp. BGYR3]|uniref:hypothetical protein n=1 Tax=Sphingomonas sp. BGYR3 TaxID=2975483 RepID=UPI0021A703FD|nr:hypothetical protein [Sphingomonas sp. BGYR3]MDG5487931.1 hypothetical protein [Sphingomonas sp. BGYR3]
MVSERDEALVLFELLCRWFDDDAMPPGDHFAHRAEYAVLDGLRQRLAVTLDEPFRADYLRLLTEARDRIADAWTGESPE